MAVYPATPAGRARADVHRLRLSRHLVYACRSCRGAVRVTSAHYLPEACPDCGASTWGDDLHCTNSHGCDAVRRPGIRGRAHCHACGASVWTLVSAGPAARLAI
jgi:hypothetical protein